MGEERFVGEWDWDYQNHKPKAEVQAVGGKQAPATPTSKDQGSDEESVQESDGAEGPWFVLIPGEVSRWRGCNTEELAIQTAENLVTHGGCPLVYVAKGVHCKISDTVKQFYTMLLIERKPTVLNEGEID